MIITASNTLKKKPPKKKHTKKTHPKVKKKKKKIAKLTKAEMENHKIYTNLISTTNTQYIYNL